MLYEQARDPLEVLDGGTDSGLQLDDGLSAGSDLVVDNDLEVQLFVVEHTLDSATLHVQVVGVEDLSAGGGGRVSMGVLRCAHTRRPAHLESGNVLELVELADERETTAGHQLRALLHLGISHSRGPWEPERPRANEGYPRSRSKYLP